MKKIKIAQIGVTHEHAGETLAAYRELPDGCKARLLPFQMGYMFRGNPECQFNHKLPGRKTLITGIAAWL